MEKVRCPECGVLIAKSRLKRHMGSQRCEYNRYLQSRYGILRLGWNVEAP